MRTRRLAWLEGATLWRRGTWAWIVTLLLTVSACGGSGTDWLERTQPSNKAMLVSGVTVLDAATQGLIVAADASALTFSGAPPGMATLKAGDVFIAQDLARKVVSVQTAGGNTVVQTSSPELGEVYRSIQVSLSIPLTDDLRVTGSASPRARALREVPQAVSVASSNGRYTITVQAGVVGGTVVIDQPQVEVDYNFGAAAPTYAKVRFRAAETLDLGLAVSGSTAIDPVDIQLLEFKVPIAVTGGTILLDVVLNLHFTASGNATVSASVHQASTVDAGITATLDPFDVKVSNNSGTPTLAVSPPQFKGQLSATAALQPKYDLKLMQFELAGMENQLGVRATVTETLSASNACERLTVGQLYSASAYLLLPQVALAGVFSWDEFWSRLNNLSMQKATTKLFEITPLPPVYDSGDICVASNQPPVADPGAAQTVASGAQVGLDGSASRDADGTIVTYAWTQTAGPLVALSGASTAVASFVAPTGPATLGFRLTVTDDGGASSSGDVAITVNAAPPPPTAPAAPVDVAAQAGDAQLQLSWSPVAGATGYNVYYATAAGVTPLTYAALPGGTRVTGAVSPQTIAGLANGLTYHLVVTALNAVGESGASLEVSATPHAASGSGAAQRHPTLALSIGAACVVLRDGTVRCWGSGPLGDGTTTQVVLGSATPVQVVGIASATELTAGDYHMCALLADTTVRCWGNNQFLQLGDGTTVTRANAPTQVVGLSGVVALSSGANFTCALLSGGSVKCWGDNQGKQLGVPTGGFVATPVTVPNLAAPIAMGAGGSRNCFVTSDNRVQCMSGSGPGGAPILVDQGFSRAVGLAVEAGDNMCALLDDGSAACFGSNIVGQLGNGSTTPSQTPVAVSGLAGAAWISGGSFATHHCALLATGSLRCWGNNDSGQLGTGSFSSTAFSSTPQAVVGIANAVTVAGAYRETCAVLADGTVRCWGQRYWVGADSGLLTGTPEAIAGITNAR